MIIDKNEFIDRLTRAYEMEEDMAGALIDLCEPSVLPTEISNDLRERLRKILLGIKADTLRHKTIVEGILENLK